MTTLLFDNEPLTVLMAPRHTRCRTVMAHIEAARQHDSTVLLTPTAVRVEAGWDRTDPRAADINRLRIHDVPLANQTTVNTAARLSRDYRIAVADAHLAAAARDRPGCTVLTSDPSDIRRATDPVDIAIISV